MRPTGTVLLTPLFGPVLSLDPLSSRSLHHLAIDHLEHPLPRHLLHPEAECLCRLALLRVHNRLCEPRERVLRPGKTAHLESNGVGRLEKERNKRDGKQKG